MSRLLRRRTILSIAASLVVAASALTQAQERRGREGSASPKPANPNAERASGVILKVEPITKGASSGSTIEGEAKKGRASKVSHRLTINTAAVWRDWARDQVVEKPTESPKAEATKGANSVATKGEPADKVTLVVIDLGPETRVHTRFRLVSDETSRGYRTPEEARTANHDPAARKSHASKTERKHSEKSAKPTHFRAGDLRPGLFVEIDFRHKPAQDVASSITVIRPIEPVPVK